MNIFSKCDQILKSGRNAALATVLEASSGTPGKAGFKLVLADDGERFGTVGGGALENRAIEDARGVLASGKGGVFRFDLAELGMECGGSVEMVIEYLRAVASFTLFGGGHIARALCPILESIGFAVAVFDPRPEVAEYFKDNSAQLIPGNYADFSSHADEIRKADYCVIATHSHEHDYDVLKQLIQFENEFKYLGLIGSKRKIQAIANRLENENVKFPPSVYAPVGLRIGAVTAAEIAVSIAAEVIAVKNGFKADHMRTAGFD